MQIPSLEAGKGVSTETQFQSVEERTSIKNLLRQLLAALKRSPIKGAISQYYPYEAPPEEPPNTFFA
ncbi:hypothetical protein BCON_0346g00160 [Botryotinia convoluta]|uniref:Uncharacterized protein n=1 Tax=Botryotinia convoluta TaxID=54673 RepID=A0A4Z1HH31_9HELO|nr:hypothetical protein BCON_0346g00160 [Botryotinia convoluta]